MAKKRTPGSEEGPSLIPMPEFAWPKNINILDEDDLKRHDLTAHIRLTFEGESREVFKDILVGLIQRHCIYPVIQDINDLSKYFCRKDQAEIWRRALYIAGYDV